MSQHSVLSFRESWRKKLLGFALGLPHSCLSFPPHPPTPRPGYGEAELAASVPAEGGRWEPQTFNLPYLPPPPGPRAHSSSKFRAPSPGPAYLSLGGASGRLGCCLVRSAETLTKLLRPQGGRAPTQLAAPPCRPLSAHWGSSARPASSGELSQGPSEVPARRPGSVQSPRRVLRAGGRPVRQPRAGAPASSGAARMAVHSAGSGGRRAQRPLAALAGRGTRGPPISVVGSG